MKKIFALFASLVLAASLLQAQNEDVNYTSMTVTSIGKTDMVEGLWRYGADIEKVVVNGPARVAWVTDTANYVEFFRFWENDNDNQYPSIEGNTLTMQKASRSLYLLHTTRNSLDISCIGDAVATRFDDAESLDEWSQTLKAMIISSSKLEVSTALKVVFRNIFKNDLKSIARSMTVASKNVNIYVEESQRIDRQGSGSVPSLSTFVNNSPLHYHSQPMSKPVSELFVAGNCIVMVVDDDEYLVESLHADGTRDTRDPATYITLNGTNLQINDPNGGIYYVHTPAFKVSNWSMLAGCNAFLAASGKIVSWSDSAGAHQGGGISDQHLKESVARYLDNAASGADWNKLISDNQEYMRKVWSLPKKQQKLHMAESTPQKASKDYDRTNFDFHWGFNNWGTSPVNGLVGMSDPGYDLRTSFSSYQLSYNYRLLMTNHFELSMGLGYESDVYKFNKPYVDYSDKAFQAIDTTGANGYFSTRFVTRYVQLPIGVAYRVNNHFLLKLSAIPALGWCGKHTGLKHEVHQSGSNPQDQVNLKETLNPYKLDVRLDMSFGGIGLFLQVATLPVFVEGTKIYPIKIGFMI